MTLDDCAGGEKEIVLDESWPRPVERLELFRRLSHSFTVVQRCVVLDIYLIRIYAKS